MSNPFFTLRHKLFKEKKLGQFMAIAFVEVVLIVFGILLALHIDNWNQSRSSKKKIHNLLVEINSNLSQDIVEAERAITILYQRDSIIQRVKDKKVVIQDFSSPTLLSPQYAVLTYRTLKINKNPYENLIQISHEIPSEYESIYADLISLYESGGNWLEEREQKLLEKFYPFQDYLRRNKAWWSDIFDLKELEEDAIRYFMHDPIYLNWVYEIDNDLEGLRTAIEWYKEAATDINKQIAELDL